MAEDFCAVGRPSRASTEDIKRAYRQRARERTPRRQPRRRQVRGAVQGGLARTRCCPIPSRRVRYDRFGEAGVAGVGARWTDFFSGGGGGSATCSARLRGQPVRRRLLRPDRPAARPGPRGRGAHQLRGRRLRHDAPGDGQDGRPLRAVRRHRCRARHPARDLHRVQGRDRSGGVARVSSARWSPRRRARAAAAWAR